MFSSCSVPLVCLSGYFNEATRLREPWAIPELFVAHLARGGTFMSTKVAAVKKSTRLRVPELGPDPSPDT